MTNKVIFVVMLFVVVISANDDNTTTPSTTSTTATTPTTTTTITTTTPKGNSTTTATTTTTTKTTTAAPNTTTTEKPTTPSPAPPPADKFIEAFYDEWSCGGEKLLDTKDITNIIYRETLQILHNMTDKKQYSACYTNDVKDYEYDKPKVMHLYSNNKLVCNSSFTTQRILTTFDPTKPSKNYSMACLLNQQDKISGTAFLAMGLCAHINDNNDEGPKVTSISCLEKLTPPEPSGGFAAGTFFGGMILALVLVAIGFVAYKYKCGRQGGFSQVFTVNGNEFHNDVDVVDTHDPVLNLSTGRLDLITT